MSLPRWMSDPAIGRHVAEAPAHEIQLRTLPISLTIALIISLPIADPFSGGAVAAFVFSCFQLFAHWKEAKKSSHDERIVAGIGLRLSVPAPALEQDRRAASFSHPRRVLSDCYVMGWEAERLARSGSSPSLGELKGANQSLRTTGRVLRISLEIS